MEKRRSRANTDMTKVFITTIPKSGTYFLGSIVEKLGFDYSGLFLSPTLIEDHRNADQETIRKRPKALQRSMLLNESSKLVKNGQYSMGHIPPHPELKDWKIIFGYRNLRDVVISATRYFSEREDWDQSKFLTRGHLEAWKAMPMSTEKVKIWIEQWGNEYAALTKAMLSWKTQPCYQVQYETINASTIVSIAQYIEKPICIEEAQKILNGLSTPTYNKKHSSHEGLWNKELESVFNKTFKQTPIL